MPKQGPHKDQKPKAQHRLTSPPAGNDRYTRKENKDTGAIHPQQLARYPDRPGRRPASYEFLKDKMLDAESEECDREEGSPDRDERRCVQRTIERKNVRTSGTYSSGTLWAAKWPPWSYVFQ